MSNLANRSRAGSGPMTVAFAYLSWLFHRAGYLVRPYDMLADERRWFWQPRRKCGWRR